MENYSELEIIETIKDIHSDWIYSLSFLKDGRLVSSDADGRIVIYDKDSYNPCIIIKEDFAIHSVLVLKNGNLITTGPRNIEVWEIDGNNYRRVQKLEGHKKIVFKVIELENGDLCSCSGDGKVKIWNDNYQCTQTLVGHDSWVYCVLEVNRFLVSLGGEYGSNTIIWDKSTYQSINTIKGIYCLNNCGASKLKDNTIIIGNPKNICVFDVSSFQSTNFPCEELDEVWSIFVLREDQVLLGNKQGTIFCFNSLSNQITHKKKMHDSGITCIVENEGKIFSSSHDKSINVYTKNFL